MLVRNHTGEFAICLFIMTAAIVFVQWSVPVSVLWVGLFGLFAYILYRLDSFSLSKLSDSIRETFILALSMSIGFILYRFVDDLIKNGLSDHEAWGIILSRLSLVLFVLPLALRMILTEKGLFISPKVAG